MNLRDLKVMNDDSCSTNGPDANANTQMCATHKSAKNVCYRGTGLPLTINYALPGTNKKYYVIAIHSQFSDCQKIDKPRLFIKISAYMDWILNTLSM